MSCPNSSSPQCCAPPKKAAEAVAPPTCSSLPSTLTFTCPSDDCQAKQAKPFCPEKPKVDCTSIGSGSGASSEKNSGNDCNANPVPAASSSDDGSCSPSSVGSVVDKITGGGGSGGAGGCSSNTSCEIPPLTMDGGCSK